MKRYHMSLVSALICILYGSSAAAQPAAHSFEQAYEREIQLLQKEKTVFESRLADLKSNSQQTIETLTKEAASLGDELIRLRIANDTLEEQIQRNQTIMPEAATETDSGVEALWRQAATIFPQIEMEQLRAAKVPEENVVKLFQHALSQVKHLGSIRKENGHWFSRDGKKQTGEILFVSGVGAFGLDKSSGGSLHPTGSGEFQIVAPLNDGVLKYAKSGKGAMIDAFLYDPLQGGQAVPQQDKTLRQIFLSGGFVMWPILALAILGILIVLERMLVLRRIHTNADRLMKKVGIHILNNAWDTARAVCEKNRGAVARVLEVILRNRLRSRVQQEELVYEVILAQKPKMDRFLSVLNIIAAVAPLLGLLGTVTGMIGTFDIITVHGTGDPQMLSGGISEALLTTQFGLVVAIPALFAHAVLSSRVDHVIGDVETNAIRLLNQLHVTQAGLCDFETNSDCGSVAV